MQRRQLLAAMGAACCSTAGCIETLSGMDRTLTLAEFAFTRTEPEGFGEYTEHPLATYRPGESVHWYVELSDVKVENGQCTIGVTTDIDGPGLSTEYSEYTTRRFSSDQSYMAVSFWRSVTTETYAPEGSYQLDLQIRDQHAEDTVFVAETFYLSG